MLEAVRITTLLIVIYAFARPYKQLFGKKVLERLL